MNRRRILLAGAGAAVVAVLAALGPALALGSSHAGASATRVQHMAITVLANDQVVQANFALAPGVPVEITLTNRTNEFHTFSIPGLHVNVLLRPAQGGTPWKTTVTFLAHNFGTFTWRCMICPSGIHGMHHAMGGRIYMIINPAAVA